MTAQNPITAAAPRHSADPGSGVIGPPRVVIDEVRPAIDGGRFPIKRTVGEAVIITAVVFADGHDILAGVLKYRACGSATTPDAWEELPLQFLGNDRWTATFSPISLGIWEYTVEAWIDRFATWLHALVAKAGADQDVASELLEGAGLINASVQSSSRTDQHGETAAGDLRLLEFADWLRQDTAQSERVAIARDPELLRLMTERPDRRASAVFPTVLQADVDSVRARFSAWYEMFPRSSTSDATRPGTLRDAEARLPDVAAMGFDVLYLPPVHPIGTTHRKGRNNTLVAGPADPGSPWAIGSKDGGHTAIHPELGTLNDFDHFVAIANRLGLEVALDIAFQASPDHPWVVEHPSWFRHRPDGSIKYAENPPKKYQDIYPFDFDSHDWRELWDGLRDVFLFWIEHGIRIFRVDNPHTKSFRFWEWCLATIRKDYPDTIFLAEAFTRPAVMRYLAKAGFNQSYTYFTWRNSADELRAYLTELTTTDLRDVMRPNFFTNTPDILHEYLQRGGRAAFQIRLLLAATLSASYGIYSGYELCEHVPVRPGSEEYLDSEKYQIRVRDWNAFGNIKQLIARVNRIRRTHPALQRNDTLRFHGSDNPTLLAYSKTNASGDRVFVVVNTDPHHMQHGWVEFPGAPSGADGRFVVHDLLDDARYTWRGDWNYVRLDPDTRFAHVLVAET